jgi:hypothetical protein
MRKCPEIEETQSSSTAMHSSKVFLSPNGKQIIGTAETVLATARIAGIDPDTQEPEYEGGTEIHWDTQKTVERGGKIIFVCVDGDQWTFDQLVPAGPELETDDILEF